MLLFSFEFKIKTYIVLCTWPTDILGNYGLVRKWTDRLVYGEVVDVL